MGQWKHEYTEPPIDLRLLGSRPADLEKTADQYVYGLSSALKLLEDALDEPELAELLETIGHQGALNSDLLRLTALCSVLRERSRRRTLQAAE